MCVERLLGLQDFYTGHTLSEDLSVGTPQLCPMIWKGPTQLDSSWPEKNVIFAVFPLFFWSVEVGSPSWSSWVGGNGRYFVKVPLSCPQPCPALAKPL